MGLVLPSILSQPEGILCTSKISIAGKGPLLTCFAFLKGADAENSLLAHLGEGATLPLGEMGIIPGDRLSSMVYVWGVIKKNLKHTQKQNDGMISWFQHLPTRGLSFLKQIPDRL